MYRKSEKLRMGALFISKEGIWYRLTGAGHEQAQKTRLTLEGDFEQWYCGRALTAICRFS